MMKPGNMRQIRRIIAALVLAVTALLCAAAPALAAPADASGETLTVGVPAERCPMFYRDDGAGEIVGIGADLMRAAATEAGYAIDFRVIGETTLKEALDNPDYDLVMPFGSALTSAAGQATVVSESLLQTPFTLVTEEKRQLPALGEVQVGMLRSLGAGAETVTAGSAQSITDRSPQAPDVTISGSFIASAAS